TAADLSVIRQEKDGICVATDNAITIALETELTPELIREGYARELVSKIQNLRKETNLEVSDRIQVTLSTDNAELLAAANEFSAVICGETLADKLETVEAAGGDTDLNGINCSVTICKN
ncbi:MAG: isoleucine--tRNA ligase, partial [Lentisphaeria bacterium]|nr:isoleucine--tRNA ligase [Lentisphaeria bacterium]